MHPRPRGAGLRRPDLLGQPSAHHPRRRGGGLAAGAVGYERLQVTDAVQWWGGRVTRSRSEERGRRAEASDTRAYGSASFRRANTNAEDPSVLTYWRLGQP